MAAAVAELVELENHEREKADARFQDLLDRLETGEGVADGQALKILRDAGKTPADVDAELNRRKRVAELRTLIADVGDLVEKKRQLTERRSALKREWDEAAQRFQTEMSSIDKQLTHLNGQMSDVDSWRRQLRELCPPPANVRELEAELCQCIGEIARVQGACGPFDPDEKAAEAKRYDALIEKLQAEVAETHPILGIVKRAEIRSRLNAAVRERDRAQGQATKCSRTRPFWTKLKSLRARHAELQEKQRQLAPAD